MFSCESITQPIATASQYSGQEVEGLNLQESTKQSPPVQKLKYRAWHCYCNFVLPSTLVNTENRVHKNPDLVDGKRNGSHVKVS